MSALIWWVALAGAVGAVCRFLATVLIPRRTPESFPMGILLVNLVGSLVAGLTLGLVTRDAISLDIAVIIWAGLCGGLTTFSTFAVDTVQLGQSRIRASVVNAIATLGGGVTAAGVGFVSAQLWVV